MNKFIIFSSFIFVIIIHFSILNYFKTSKIQNSQTQDNNPILLQIAKIEPKTETKVEVQKEVVIIEKKVEKPIAKPTPIKPVEKPIAKPTPIKPVEKPLPIKKTASLVKEEIIENKNLKNSEVVQKTETHSNEEKIEKENEYLTKYKTELREEINKNKTYPTISRKLKEQGKVIVSFRVMKNGLFENIKLSGSSNIKRLDEAALNALYETKKFKPFENEINKEFVDFELPLEFIVIN